MKRLSRVLVISLCAGALVAVAEAKPNDCAGSGMQRVPVDGGHVTHDFVCMGGQWQYSDSYFIPDSGISSSGGRQSGPDAGGNIHIVGRGSIFGSITGGGRDAGGGGGGGGSSFVAAPTEGRLASPNDRYLADGNDPRGRQKKRGAIDGDIHRVQSQVGHDPAEDLASDGKNPPRLNERGLAAALGGSDDEACRRQGSLIECQAQVLNEQIGITGTSLRLFYRSTNVPGYRAGNDLVIPVIGDTVPKGLNRVHVIVAIDGQAYVQTYAASPNVVAPIRWNGKADRLSYVRDGSNAYVQVGYEYPAEYRPTTPSRAREEANHLLVPPGTIEGGAAYIKWSTYVGPVGVWDARLSGMGGWTVSQLHSFNPKTHQVRYGDGTLRSVFQPTCTQRSADNCIEYRILRSDGSAIDIFDGDGFLVQTFITSIRKPAFTFAYQGTGTARRIRTITDADGRVTTFELDGANNVGLIRGPYGEETHLRYDADGFLARVEHPNNAWTQLTYRGRSGLLATKTDPEASARLFTDASHHYEFDCDGRLTRDADPDGKLQSLARWQSAKKPEYAVTHTLAPHYASEYRVRQDPFSDDATETLTTTDTAGLVTTTARNLDGSRTRRVLPGGAIVEETTEPHPQFPDDVQVPATRTLRLPSGKTITERIRLEVELADPADPLSVVRRTVTTTATNGDGQSRALVAVYDAIANRVTITTPSGRVESARYDEWGRIVELNAPGQAALTFGYQDGKLTSMHQGTRVSTLSYDGRGRLSRVEAGGDGVDFTAFDAMRRPLSWSDPLGIPHQVERTRDGDIYRVYPPGRAAHQTPPTLGGRTAGYTPPDNGTTPDVVTSLWNSAGRLSEIDRGDGVITTRMADGAGRLVSTLHTIPTGLPVVPVGTPLFTYDAMSGVVREIQAQGGPTTTIGYEDGIPSSLALAGEIQGTIDGERGGWLLPSAIRIAGVRAALEYDADGRLASLGDLTIARSPTTGQIQTVTLGKSLLTVAYDATYGHATALAWSYDGGPSLAFERDVDGHGLTSARRETRGAATTTFGYTHDKAGRLTQVTRTAGATTTQARYGYDDNGNRIFVDDNGGVLEAAKGEIVYDERDQLTRYGELTFEYSRNGELTKRTDTKTGAVTTYRYSAMGPLAEVDLPDGRKLQYVLDGGLSPVGKRIDGKLVSGMLFDGDDRLVAELGSDGATVTARFFYASQRQLPDYLEKSGHRYRVVRDHLGSPRQIVDVADGSVAQELEFDAWGNVVADTNPGFQPFGFAGGVLDRDTGLLRFGQRYYDPRVGRFIQRDPVLFAGGTTNLFEYAYNNPIDYVDLDGYQAVPPGGAPLAGTVIRWDLATAKAIGEARAAEEVAVELADDIQRVTRSGRIEPFSRGIPDLVGARTANWAAQGASGVTPGGFVNRVIALLQERGIAAGFMNDGMHPNSGVNAAHRHFTVTLRDRLLKVRSIHVLGRALAWSGFFYVLGKTGSVQAATLRMVDDFVGTSDMNGGDSYWYMVRQHERLKCEDFSDQVSSP